MKKSSSWAIGEAIALGGGKGKGGGGLGLYSLIDVDNQIKYGLFIVSGGISGGIPFQFTISERGSFAFFTTTTPIPATDFRGRVYFGSALDFSNFAGLSVIDSVTFHGVDHDPYWINTGGLENGISFSIIGVSFGVAWLGDGTSITGCEISPAGDPWCGGYTPNPTQSGGTSQSGGTNNSTW